MIPALILSMALSWVQVRSDVFVVKSSAGLDRAKRVLRELETFRELIGSTLVFQNVILPELPIEVLVVGDQSQYNDLSPEYNGKKVRVAGYYERAQDRDFIVLDGNLSGNTTHVVYHELTHSFLSRSLDARPAWLSEGLAEYFATADIQDDAIYLGGLSNERLDFLKSGRLIPLEELLGVDDRSPYYNESAKANIFYAESWAFVHFLMHGPHKQEFTNYLELLTRGDVPFADRIKTPIRTLEVEFESYLKTRIRLSGRDKVKPHPAAWSMTTDQVTNADVELAITEILLSSGRLEDARRHLAAVAETDTQFPRTSYYRGILSRITREGDPHELFIDALMDPNFGPRAAVNLVQLHELSIPGARRALEQAAASGTRMGDVYWALTEIYLDDARRALELMKLAAAGSVQPAAPRSPVITSAEPPELPMKSYSRGDGEHFRYELLSPSGAGPRVQMLIAPFFPEELLSQRLSGQVVVDVQVTDNGEVAGIWLISATPEIFGDLATTAVHDWKFESATGKIRVALQFIP